MPRDKKASYAGPIQGLRSCLDRCCCAFCDMNHRRVNRSDTFKSAPVPLTYLVAAVRGLPLARPLWNALGRHLWTALHPRESRWLVDQLLRRIRLKLASQSRNQAIAQLLTESPVPELPETRITIQIPSRKLGNRDNHLEEVLNSFLQMTRHPENCEILLKVDDDDDLSYFYGIKREFAGLNLRFFLSPRGRGYGDAHIHQSILADNASPTSQAWAFISDDSPFCQKDWDLDVYELVERERAFIAGSQPADSVTTVIDADSASPNNIFSYACEPYPIVSRSLIDGLRLASESVVGWTTFGDRFCFDGLWSAIVHILREQHGFDVYHRIAAHCARYPQRFSWSGDPERSTTRTEALTHFFSPPAVETRSRVVRTMVENGLISAPANAESVGTSPVGTEADS